MSGPSLLYLLVVAVSAFAAVPVCRRVFDGRYRLPLLSLGLTVGIPVMLLLFSLLARVAPAYEAAVPATLALMLVPWAWYRVRSWAARSSGAGDAPRQDGPAAWDGRADVVLFGGYGLLFALLLALRSDWPSLYWANDVAHAGSEKVFNLSLIQAYLFGRGFPPENLWLAGQPVDYYVLLHALPGLVSWGWRVLTGEAGVAGELFLFSDVFLLLLGSFALSAWSQALLVSGDSGLSRRQSLVVSLALGIGVLLSTHAKAVQLVLGAVLGGTEPAWWELEREVVPYTYSQYPFYLLLQGDHHPFQRVFFLQIALYGAMLLVFLARRPQWRRAALAGALAAAVLLAHSGSVLLDAVVFGAAAAGVAGFRAWRGEWWLLRAFAVNLGTTTAVALALSVPALWHGNLAPVAWYWVEAAIASPLAGFLEAQAGPVVFVIAALAAGVTAARRGAAQAGVTGGSRVRSWRRLVTIAAVAGLLVVAGRDGAAVAVACALLVLMLAPKCSSSGEDRTPLVILSAAVFAVWLMPEFVAADLASRPVVEWKRWNFTMRFWLEGHYLVPFLAVLAFAPALRRALDDRGYVRALAAGSVSIGALWLVVHAYGVADRIARTPDIPGSSGTAFLARQHPCDAAIVEYLRGIDERVRLGELCGTGEVLRGIPLDYGWAGRIAAFSGRPGICGWTRHVWQFTPALRRGPAAGQWTWTHFRGYEQALQRAYEAARNGMAAPDARSHFDGLGVTHLVVGEQERRLFPGLSGAGIARAVSGQVVFETGDSCAVVRLSPP